LKKVLFTLLALVLAIGLVVPAAVADTTWGGSKAWTGQGSNSEACWKVGDGPYRTEDGWIHWVLTQSTGVTTAELVINEDELDEYVVGFPSLINPPDAIRHGGAIQFFTPYFDIATLTATVYYNGALGSNSQFVISDYCGGGGGGEPAEVLSVYKTAVTSYTRTHNWSIDKSVDTDNGYKEGGYPKIWLYTDGSGDESATWTVNVTYDGYVDSDFNVSGEITIENTGVPGYDLDASITGAVDELDDTTIDVTWEGEDGNPVTFPYTLAPGHTLTGTYSEGVGSKIEGSNYVTVTTPEFEYWADAEINWGDPTTEVNKIVTIVDNSDLFGEQSWGPLDAADYEAGDVVTFTYPGDFAWEDYGEQGCGDYTYDNTAQVIGDDEVVLDSADATLKVNVQCYIYETAYAKKGSGAICFIPTFANWGWTNPITTSGTYTWNLWAGAGQCDTSKGTLVGNVTVVRTAGGYITVTYNVNPGYLLEETHVYAGCDQFPKVKQGKKLVSTVAPGQYYNASPVNCTTAYVIAHAVVGIPDPNFGP